MKTQLIRGPSTFVLMALAILAFLAMFTSACGDNGISKEDLNKALNDRDATAVAKSKDISSDSKVVEVVSDYRANKLTIVQMAAKIKTLGYTDEQIDAYIKTALNGTFPTPQGKVDPSQTATPTVPLQATPTPASLKGAGSMPKFTTEVSHGTWKIQGTERLPQNQVVAGVLSRLMEPDPAHWRTFPNIPNPDVSTFRVVNGTQVPDGVEYGTYSSPFCFSHPCDLTVGAWEYRYISGDYSFLGTECKGDMKHGCMLLLINVMDQSYTWRSQDVDNGFTLRGRYWNGDTLEWGIQGLVSHGSANLLNMPTLAHPGEVLNSGDPGNSGANCGTPKGCGSVDVTVVIHAGDAIIAVAKTTVTK